MRNRLLSALLLLLCLASCSSLKPPPTPTLSPLAVRGKAVFELYCSRCHGVSGETVIVGPSLAGIATRAAGRVEGMDARTYIQNSVVDPAGYMVEGFPEGVMPADLQNQISPEDLEAVVEYLLSME